jgi:hypothetical protein
VVRCNLISGAILLAGLVMTQSCLAQEALAPAQDKKPAGPPTNPGGSRIGSGTGGMQNMMQRMREMSEKPGGAMGMMGQMRGGRMGEPGKQGQAAEPTLEEMLNKALKDNPDIRVAEAKVREGEAELNRTRLQVTQKVLAFHHTRESQKAIVKVAEEDLQRIQKLEASKAVSQDEVRQAQQRLSAAKAKLAEVEGEMHYLIGQQHGALVSSVTFSPDGKTVLSGAADGTVKLWDARTGQQISMPYLEEKIETFQVRPLIPPDQILGPFNVTLPERHITIGKITHSAPEAGTIADKVRKALDTTVTVDYQDKTVEEVLKDLEKKFPDLSFHAPSVSGFAVTVKGSFPLKALLQLIQDTCYELGTDPPTGYSFAVRDYGLLLAPDNRIPPGAIRLQDLQKEKTPAKEDKKQDGQKKQ